MIDDAAFYRAQPGAFTVSPRGNLPAWSPTTPPAGWTPLAVFVEALAYADDVEGTVEAPRRRIVAAAYQALMTALPLVKRAEIKERLRGVERFRDYLDGTPSAPPLAPVVDDPEDLPF